MRPKRFVITGAPGTGKTAIINCLEEKGYHCYHEIIRDMTSKELNDENDKEVISNPLLFANDPAKFNLALLEGRLVHYNNSKQLELPFCFFDRGLPDVLAYMDFFKQAYDAYFVETCKNNRYTEILITPPWREIYVRDGQRLETFEEAEAIHEALMKTYRFFDYQPIEIPKDTILQRTNFVIEKLAITI